MTHTPTPWDKWDVYSHLGRKSRMFGVAGSHAVGRVEAYAGRDERDRDFILRAVNAHDAMVSALRHIAFADRAMFNSEEPINVARSALALLNQPSPATPITTKQKA